MKQELINILRYAKEHSLFYKELYKNIDCDHFNWNEVPFIDQKPFWDANNIEHNTLLTSNNRDGIVFKSGGTTGAQKFSFFSYSEWKDFTHQFGKGLLANQLSAGEKVANLYYAGSLYASFLFIHTSMTEAQAGTIFPISGAAPEAEIMHTLEEFQITTLAGVPTTIMRLVDYLIREGRTDLPIKKILYGGESFYPDQREYILSHYPDCKILSVGYASVDGGEIGYADPSCGIDEHRVFDQSTYLEIIDEETGLPIEEIGIIGKIYLTNLNRKLMPIIRYPVGDKAMWMEEQGTPHRKYKLAGRTEEGARIGPATLYMNDVADILKKYFSDIQVAAFQIVIKHENQKDFGVLRIASNCERRQLEQKSRVIVERVYEERKMFKELLEKDLISPLVVQWVTFDELEKNERTGKLKRVIDQRFS